jgi:hypothetical protein
MDKEVQANTVIGTASHYEISLVSFTYICEYLWQIWS